MLPVAPLPTRAIPPNPFFTSPSLYFKLPALEQTKMVWAANASSVQPAGLVMSGVGSARASEPF
jgi:hypothetical protein